MVNGERNFRWNYIRNEYKLRLIIGEETDWFIVQKPKRSRNGKIVTNVVTCPHISTTLKKKNIYFVFDEENGIDTIQNLIQKVLVNTGWTLGVCDILMENDGSKQKIRSIQSEGKQGTYGLITEICNLFNAYPTYHGDSRTVDIHALSNKQALGEMTIGKNLDAITVEENSENIVTRLYVEGEYGDSGYVGIDSVNPTGLSYIFNFDYYKEIGAFTQEHQDALDQYLVDIAAARGDVSAITQQLVELEDQLNTLMGQPSYIFYMLDDGVVDAIKRGGNATEEQEAISLGDELIILKATGPYRTVTVDSVPFVFEGQDAAGGADVYAYKFISPSSGLIGAKEVAISAKEELVTQRVREIEQTEDAATRERLRNEIANLNAEIEVIYNGTPESTGLYDMMRQAAVLTEQIYDLELQLDTATGSQDEVEATFYAAMGDMLNDGYWSDTNYTVGQEESLYNDAVDVLAQLSKPAVSYTVNLVTLSEAMGMTPDNFMINSRVRLYDPEVPINDLVYVDKLVRYLDNPSKDTVEISNTDIALTGQGYSSVMSRITELADMVDQKNAIYNRAAAFDSTGQMDMDRLNGVIDVLKNNIVSSVSSWYTDDSGNIIFESVDGTSAMMLSGEGFAIADGKTQEGQWNWRSFGTGHGFTADLITAGTLAASRIDVAHLDMSVNSSFQIAQGEINARFDDVDGRTNQMQTDIDGLQQSIISADGHYLNLETTVNGLQATVGEIEGTMQYISFTEDEGLVIGSNSDNFRFRATSRTLEVAGVKTMRLGIAQSMEEDEDWAWVASSTGLGLKYVGPTPEE